MTAIQQTSLRTAALLTSALLFAALTACQPADSDKKADTKTTAAAVKKEPVKPACPKLAPTPGDIIAEQITPIESVNLLDQPNGFIQVTAKVVNVEDDRTWAVVQAGDQQIFAFAHAGLELIPNDAVGQTAYIRAAVESRPMHPNDRAAATRSGLTPHAVVESTLSPCLHLNVIKFAVANQTTPEAFDAGQNFR